VRRREALGGVQISDPTTKLKIIRAIKNGTGELHSTASRRPTIRIRFTDCRNGKHLYAPYEIAIGVKLIKAPNRTSVAGIGDHKQLSIDSTDNEVSRNQGGMW
jgi:hypothetical protein